MPIQFISVALLPAIFEEAACRGIVLQALLGTDMSKRRAIVYSAVVFAAAHGSLVRFPGCFVFGVLVGWIFVRTRSLLPGMLMHVANNAIVLFFAQPDPLPSLSSDWMAAGLSSMQLLAIALAGLALAAAGVVACRRVLAHQVISSETREAIHDFLARAA